MNTPKQACWLVRKIFDTREWLLQKDPSSDLNKYYLHGKFSIKKLYVASMHQYPKRPWKRIIVGSKVLPRHQFILWLALHRRLATVDRLRKWGLSISSDCVLFGKNNEETTEHLLFECDYSRTISSFLQWMGERHQIESWNEKIEWLTKNYTCRVRAHILGFLFVAVVYHIWAEKNQRRF